MSGFDEFLRRQRARLEAAETLQSIARDFPDLVLEFVRHFGAGTDTKRSDVGSLRRNHHSATSFDRIVQFFRDNGNTWTVTTEIADGTGIDKKSIGSILYRDRAEDLEKRDSPEGGRAKEWRLKPEVYAAATGGDLAQVSSQPNKER